MVAALTLWVNGTKATVFLDGRLQHTLVSEWAGHKVARAVGRVSTGRLTQEGYGPTAWMSLNRYSFILLKRWSRGFLLEVMTLSARRWPLFTRSMCSCKRLLFCTVQ